MCFEASGNWADMTLFSSTLLDSWSLGLSFTRTLGLSSLGHSVSRHSDTRSLVTRTLGLSSLGHSAYRLRSIICSTARSVLYITVICVFVAPDEPTSQRFASLRFAWPRPSPRFPFPVSRLVSPAAFKPYSIVVPQLPPATSPYSAPLTPPSSLSLSLTPPLHHLPIPPPPAPPAPHTTPNSMVNPKRYPTLTTAAPLVSISAISSAWSIPAGSSSGWKVGMARIGRRKLEGG
jgi:hypothetical protein